MTANSFEDETIPKKIEIIGEYIKGGETLDVGGRKCPILRDLKTEKYCVDLYPQELDDIEVKKVDLNYEKIPYPDIKFDYLIATELLEHVYNIENTMKEMRRVLKNKGLIFASVPLHSFLKNVFISLFKFEGHFGIHNQPDQKTRHINFFTEGKFKELFKKYGFIDIRTEKIGRFWPLNKDLFVMFKKIDKKSSVK